MACLFGRAPDRCRQAGSSERCAEPPIWSATPFAKAAAWWRAEPGDLYAARRIAGRSGTPESAAQGRGGRNHPHQCSASAVCAGESVAAYQASDEANSAFWLSLARLSSASISTGPDYLLSSMRCIKARRTRVPLMRHSLTRSTLGLAGANLRRSRQGCAVVANNRSIRAVRGGEERSAGQLAAAGPVSVADRGLRPNLANEADPAGEPGHLHG